MVGRVRVRVRVTCPRQVWHGDAHDVLDDGGGKPGVSGRVGGSGGVGGGGGGAADIGCGRGVSWGGVGGVNGVGVGGGGGAGVARLRMPLKHVDLMRCHAW